VRAAVAEAEHAALSAVADAGTFATAADTVTVTVTVTMTMRVKASARTSAAVAVAMGAFVAATASTLEAPWLWWYWGADSSSQIEHQECTVRTVAGTLGACAVSWTRILGLSAAKDSKGKLK